MADLVRLKDANVRRWKAANLTRGPEFLPVAKRLVAGKDRYLTVSKRTGIPWPFIAVTHQRESSQNWSRSLAQGDLWDRVSTHVPRGRGPFTSWEAAAYDALVNCSPYAARNKDWSIGGLLTLLEQYNGLGYVNKGLPSPYIWSGTDQYSRGKYVADGVFDASAVDKQLGCAGLIMAMMSLDSSITFTGAAITQNTTLPPANPVTLSPNKPAVSTAAKATTIGAGTIIAGAGAAASQAGLSAPEILAIITGVSLAIGGSILIGYRIMKGYWPWTSTGKASPGLSPLSPQSSGPSLEQVSEGLLAVSSAASPVTPLPQPLARKKPRKQLVKPSRKTPTPRKKSSSSKPTVAKKSERKRKLKSKN